MSRGTIPLSNPSNLTCFFMLTLAILSVLFDIIKNRILYFYEIAERFIVDII